MDNLYSLALLLSLIAGTAALASAVFSYPVPPSERLPPPLLPRRTWNRFAAVAVALSTLCLGVSLTVHLIWGHRPGSSDGLGFADFLRIHPSFLAAAALPSVAELLRRIRSRAGK